MPGLWPDTEGEEHASLLSAVFAEAERITTPEEEPEQEEGEVDLGPWEDWLHRWFPAAVAAPFAPRHRRLWNWFEALVPGIKPKARCEFWPRGGAKSSTAELGVVRIGQKKSRKFCLYVCGTQGQANKHVQTIRARFETLGISRGVNRYGSSLGWRLDLLRTINGFNVLALGLDAAGRGVKLEDVRPDIIILDDIDARHDSAKAVAKKRATLTESILPMGAPDAAILFVQNLMHSDSLASEQANGSADWLLNREVYEEPAVRDLEIAAEIQPDGLRRYRIVAGEATWEGQNLQTCEDQLNEWSRPSFMREAQHVTDESEDGLWQRARDIDPFRIERNKLPPLIRIGVGVDPTATAAGDEAGIIAAGVAWVHSPLCASKRVGGEKCDCKPVLHGYVLEDASLQGSPHAWAGATVQTYKSNGADRLVAEKNNGGEMVRVTIQTVPGAPAVKLVHASRGKLTRAEPVQSLYEEGRVHHVGSKSGNPFVELEREMCNWKPGEPSPNRMDALVWILTELMLTPQATPWAFAA